MPKLNFTGDRGAILAAAIGATGALLLAVFVSPVSLLAAEAVACGGAYAYSRIRKQACREAKYEVIDAEFKEVK